MELGRLGIWSGLFSSKGDAVRDVAAELEALGYSALWFPNTPESFTRGRDLLDATRHVVVATGIASIWTHRASEAAAAHAALEAAHPGRFLLGLGVSHAHLVDRDEPGTYAQPLARMREYLDALDAAPTPVPPGERILAALGPRMLELARERSVGAHPYLVTVEHTREARQALGKGPLLAPEQAVVLETDPDRARAIARQHLARYLQAPNYARNWFRLGFSPEDVANGGSDRLVDALVVWGSAETIHERLAQHYQAGADHICLQVLTADPQVFPRAEWQALAPSA